MGWITQPAGAGGPRGSDVQGQFRLLLRTKPTGPLDFSWAALVPMQLGLGGSTVMMQAQIWCGSSWVQIWAGRDGTLLIDPTRRQDFHRKG